MEKIFCFRVKFIALTDDFNLELCSHHEDTIRYFQNEILSLFAAEDPSSGKLVVKALNSSTQKLASNIDGFVEKHKKDYPEMNRFKSYFTKLKSGEHFYLIPNNEHLEQFDLLSYKNHLESLLTGSSFKSHQQLTNEVYREVFSKYHVHGITGERQNIGEPQKEKRVCRFCKRSMPEVSFKQKAHAISEALGNKSLVLLDECDQCNSKFSKELEPSVVLFFSFLRTLFDINGKGGRKTIKGSNFSFKNEDGLVLSLKEGARLNSERNTQLLLDSGELYSDLNVYKCLCKYFISLLPTSFVPHFSKTVEWINGKYNSEKLPKIAQIFLNAEINPEPGLLCYLRRDSDFDLPYAIGEFHFANAVLIYIIPFTSEDKKEFVEEGEFSTYWKFFKQYHCREGWVFSDYSNANMKPLKINLKVERRS